jgi:hypothetical protein
MADCSVVPGWRRRGSVPATDVEDDGARPRGGLVPVMISAFEVGELPEDLLAFRLAQPLQDDLLGRLGMDPPERGIELPELDLAHRARRPGLTARGPLERELEHRISTSATATMARKTRILPVSASTSTQTFSYPRGDTSIGRLDGLSTVRMRASREMFFLRSAAEGRR